MLAPRPCSSSNSTAPDDSPGGGGIVSESNDAKQNVDGASPYPTTSIPTASRATWTYDAAYLTNHGGGGDLASRPLTETERRFGALSNGIDGLDANEWPKVQHGLRMFEDVLDEYSRGRRSQNTQIEQVRDSNDGDLPLVESDLVERLFNLLTCVFRSFLFEFTHASVPMLSISCRNITFSRVSSPCVRTTQTNHLTSSHVHSHWHLLPLPFST